MNSAKSLISRLLIVQVFVLLRNTFVIVCSLVIFPCQIFDKGKGPTYSNGTIKFIGLEKIWEEFNQKAM